MINYFKNKMNLHVPTQSFTKTYIYWGYKDLKNTTTKIFNELINLFGIFMYPLPAFQNI